MAREVLLYRAESLADAWLLRSLLEESGVHVRLAGEALTGLAGAIPVRDAEPMIWVPADQEALAKQVLDRFHGPELIHPAWICRACGEENPAGFQICWNCEAPCVPEPGASS